MARQRDPKRDIAKEIWLESKGKKILKDIAQELGVSDSQIRKWKSLDKWGDDLKSNVTNGKSNVTNKGGAPTGNKNAIGNKGNSRASPPKGNKNALKTGEYETIFAEYLSDEEKGIYQSITDDPFFVMSEEVRLLKIRQRRMMQRIADAEAGLNEKEQEMLYELRGRKTLIESKKSGKKVEVEVPDLVLTEMKEHSFRKINDVLLIEDALTRVSNTLQKAIKQLNEIEISGQRLELMKAQTDHTKAQTTKALINKDGDENDGGTVINIIDDITAQGQEGEENG